MNPTINILSEETLSEQKYNLKILPILHNIAFAC